MPYLRARVCGEFRSTPPRPPEQALVSEGARGEGTRGLIVTGGAQLTTNLHVHALKEFCPGRAQRALCVNGVRMRGPEDLPPPLEHFLQYGLSFEQVVACVLRNSRPRSRLAATRIGVYSNTGRHGFAQACCPAELRLG